jgi:hypothetical protein
MAVHEHVHVQGADANLKVGCWARNAVLTNGVPSFAGLACGAAAALRVASPLRGGPTNAGRPVEPRARRDRPRRGCCPPNRHQGPARAGVWGARTSAAQWVARQGSVLLHVPSYLRTKSPSLAPTPGQGRAPTRLTLTKLESQGGTEHDARMAQGWGTCFPETASTAYKAPSDAPTYTWASGPKGVGGAGASRAPAAGVKPRATQATAMGLPLAVSLASHGRPYRARGTHSG